jgi:hypothetical protein
MEGVSLLPTQGIISMWQFSYLLRIRVVWPPLPVDLLRGNPRGGVVLLSMRLLASLKRRAHSQVPRATTKCMSEKRANIVEAARIFSFYSYFLEH